MVCKAFDVHTVSNPRYGMLSRLMGEHGICSILVGNKTDLEVSRKVSREEAEKCVNTYGMSALFETSAREFQNVTEV